MRKPGLRYLVFILLLLAASITRAQDIATDPLTNARNFAAKKDYNAAIDIYAKLYNQNQLDAEIFNEYFEVLLTAKEYKQAERLTEERKKRLPNYPLPFIDLGRVYVLEGKEKKANVEFDASFQFINGDDNLTRLVAKRFTDMGKTDYAIRAYEHTRELLRAPYMYTGPLSNLYAAKGDVEKAILTMLEGGMGYMVNSTEDTKAGLLNILGNDPKKLLQAQKALIKRINEQPENPFYADLLTWLYTQKDDWDGALIQVIALDERNKEQGNRILEFARYAAKVDHFDVAIKAYNEVIDKGNTLPYYVIALSEKLGITFTKLQDDPFYKKEDVDKLAKEYQDFFVTAPQYYITETVRDFAKLQAIYANDVADAINTLNKAIETPNISRYLAGECKLQLGDYYILTDKIWDASLLYSQVDKTFREDVLGEEARFRNAKLSYYTGDFDWAQSQLTVLKASTSELIANDALYLSILITENITPDSNYVPIRRFAHADLLLFQNKDKEAEALLDSINTYYPKHPLRDDILMQKATLAQKHREYQKALDYLGEIHAKHGKDVLGDDAVFKTASIYEKYLQKPDEAKKYYEMLIMEYPGSTFIQTARNKLNALQSGNTVIP